MPSELTRISCKYKNSPLTLEYCIYQAEQWANTSGPEAAKNFLYWMQQVHHLATLGLSAAQDRAAKEGVTKDDTR